MRRCGPDHADGCAEVGPIRLAWLGGQDATISYPETAILWSQQRMQVDGVGFTADGRWLIAAYLSGSRGCYALSQGSARLHPPIDPGQPPLVSDGVESVPGPRWDLR